MKGGRTKDTGSTLDSATYYTSGNKSLLSPRFLACKCERIRPDELLRLLPPLEVGLTNAESDDLCPNPGYATCELLRTALGQLHNLPDLIPHLMIVSISPLSLFNEA